ncbi:hypothetical protein PybrP1_002886 [[Pythium] brassicae (nom. inval.)]|nr:hypothetical protein PybrP1_002886 [[Pythium] brassicae (nom. inval.)]
MMDPFLEVELTTQPLLAGLARVCFGSGTTLTHRCRCGAIKINRYGRGRLRPQLGRAAAAAERVQTHRVRRDHERVHERPDEERHEEDPERPPRAVALLAARGEELAQPHLLRRQEEHADEREQPQRVAQDERRGHEHGLVGRRGVRGRGRGRRAAVLAQLQVRADAVGREEEERHRREDEDAEVAQRHERAPLRVHAQRLPDSRGEEEHELGVDLARRDRLGRHAGPLVEHHERVSQRKLGKEDEDAQEAHDLPRRLLLQRRPEQLPVGLRLEPHGHDAAARALARIHQVVGVFAVVVAVGRGQVVVEEVADDRDRHERVDREEDDDVLEADVRQHGAAAPDAEDHGVRDHLSDELEAELHAEERADHVPALQERLALGERDDVDLGHHDAQDLAEARGAEQEHVAADDCLLLLFGDRRVAARDLGVEVVRVLGLHERQHAALEPDRHEARERDRDEQPGVLAVEQRHGRVSCALALGVVCCGCVGVGVGVRRRVVHFCEPEVRNLPGPRLRELAADPARIAASLFDRAAAVAVAVLRVAALARARGLSAQQRHRTRVVGRVERHPVVSMAAGRAASHLHDGDRRIGAVATRSRASSEQRRRLPLHPFTRGVDVTRALRDGKESMASGRARGPGGAERTVGAACDSQLATPRRTGRLCDQRPLLPAGRVIESEEVEHNVDALR